MRKRNDKEKIYLTLIMILTFVFMIMVSLRIFNLDKTDNSKQGDIYNGIKWSDNQKSVDDFGKQKYIAVSGITDLHFISNSVEQNVNFYNPKENKCLMDIQILTKENGIIWQMHDIKPDDNMQNITISNKFS